MSFKKKLFLTVFAVIAGLGALTGLLWYYQSQGLIKVFPTTEERNIKKLLEVDETEFSAAEGLSEEQYRAEIKNLYERRDRAREFPDDADAWIKYGYSLEFLNAHIQSAAVWERALKLQPQNFALAGSLGDVYQYFLKNYQAAERVYFEALKVAPAYVAAYEGLMDLYRYNWKEKKQFYETVVLTGVAEDVQNKAFYYKELVDFLVNENDIVKAKEYLGELRKLDEQAASELVETYSVLQ